jgi:hypothetical protein
MGVSGLGAALTYVGEVVVAYGVDTAIVASAVDSDRNARKQGKAANKNQKHLGRLAGERNEMAQENAEAEKAQAAGVAQRARRSQAAEGLVAQRQVEAQAASSGFAGTAVEGAVSDVQGQVQKNTSDINVAESNMNAGFDRQSNIFQADSGIQSARNSLAESMQPKSSSFGTAASIFSSIGNK